MLIFPVQIFIIQGNYKFRSWMKTHLWKISELITCKSPNHRNFDMSSVVNSLGFTGFTGSKCSSEYECTVKTSFLWKYLVCLLEIQSILISYTRIQLKLISVHSRISNLQQTESSKLANQHILKNYSI